MNQEAITSKQNTKIKPIGSGFTDRKNRLSPRCKIRQLLRSMLPMEDESRQLKEEQTMFR